MSIFWELSWVHKGDADYALKSSAPSFGSSLLRSHDSHISQWLGAKPKQQLSAAPEPQLCRMQTWGC